MLLRCDGHKHGHLCDARLGIVPGYVLGRRLAKGEVCSEGAGYVCCPRCGAKWEIVPVDRMEAA